GFGVLRRRLLAGQRRFGGDQVRRAGLFRLSLPRAGWVERCPHPPGCRRIRHDHGRVHPPLRGCPPRNLASRCRAGVLPERLRGGRRTSQLESRFTGAEYRGGSTSMSQTCSHLDQIQDVEPRTPEGCEECLQMGDTWVHLRECLICGHIGCCDNSKNKHATKHFHETGHPIIQSFEPGEDWRWCYVDNI